MLRSRITSDLPPRHASFKVYSPGASPGGPDGPLPHGRGSSSAAAGRLTIDSLYRDRYRPIRQLGCSLETVHQYEQLLRHLNRFVRERFGDQAAVAYADELCDEWIAGYLDWRMRTDGIVAPTANKDLRQINALWKFASRKRLSTASRFESDLSRLDEPKQIKRAWPVEKFSTILASAAQEVETLGGVPGSKFWSALLLGNYDLGVRITPLMLLRTADIDLDAATVLVRFDSQKQRADQLFQITPQTVEVWRAIWAADRKLFFRDLWPLDPDGYWRRLRWRYKRILRRAGLDATRDDLFHKIRRTTGSHIWRERGIAAAQKHLGHSHPRVTQVYGDPEITQEILTAAGLPRPTLGGSTP
jgi:integrase